MICHHCGSKIEHFTRFCSTCGTAVPATDADQTDPDLIERTTQMERPEIRVPRWRLSKMEGVKIPDGFPLHAKTRIGRDPRCEIHLPSQNISRFHAQIEWQSTGFQISDLDSTNGTYVNRHLIKEPTRLKIGATIQLGEYSFLVMKDSTVCSNCGETVRSDDRYCQYCGNSLIAPEFRPNREKGDIVVEEPFPETNPIQMVEDAGGMQTPRFSTPPFLPATGPKPAAEIPAPPPTPAPMPRSAIAPPAPPAPEPPAEPSQDPVEQRSPLQTCLVIVLVGACLLATLGGLAYYAISTGLIRTGS